MSAYDLPDSAVIDLMLNPWIEFDVALWHYAEACVAGEPAARTRWEDGVRNAAARMAGHADWDARWRAVLGPPRP